MITIKELNFSHQKKQDLFDDLTIHLNEGSITGLLGKNGAGKSTLLKLISGLIYPKKGNIDVNGFNPSKRNPHFLKDIFLVTDEPFLPSMSIQSYTKVYSELYPNFNHEKMTQILQEFELFENQKLDKISHGQQKKFIIAFALSTNCKLILLDEPTNGLDIPSKKEFRKVLVSSIEEDQLVVVSTHQVKDIETVIDKIVILDNGKIVFDKETYEITEKLQFQKVQSIQNKEEILYSEKCPGGYNIMTPSKEDEETEIDIELLFNAIINHTKINL